MADIDWSKGSLSGPDGKPVDTTDWSSGVLTEPPKPSGAIRKLIGDKALGFASGAVSVTKALTDSAGAGNKASQVLGSINDGINDYLSPEAKADQQAIAAGMADAKAKGFNLEGVKAGANAFATAPGQFVAQAAGSAAPFIVAGALSGGSAVPAMLGLAAGAGTAKGSIYDEIKKRGGTEADATKAQEYSGANVDQIALSSGLGVLDSFTGVAGAGARMLRGAIGKEVAKEAANTTQRGILGRAGMGMLKEMPLEAAQGGQEQVAANLAAQRAGYEAGTWDNVASNATLEALASAGPGAAFGAMDTTTRQTTPPTAPNQAPTDQAPPLQLGNTPDPLLSFPDGTVARRSEIDAYINGLPADQQPAARAKAMGLAPQPGTPEPVVKPSEAMGLDPAAGPLSAAAVTAVDTGAHQEIQLQQANEADQAAYEQATAEQEQKAAELDTATKPITHGPIAEAAMSDDDKRAIMFSNKTVADGGIQYPGTLDGDILNGQLRPYKRWEEAIRRVKMEGKDWRVAKVQDGFVARRKDANGSTEVQPGDTGSTGGRSTDSPASVGVGATDGNGVGTQSGRSPDAVLDHADQLPKRADAAPVASGRAQPTTLGTQTTATAGPGFTAKDVTRVQNAAPGTNTTPAAPAVEAPAVVAGDAATAPELPAAGTANLQAAGVDEAAHAAATSPLNDLPQPTEAQKIAGNYPKGHVNLNGLDLSIENPAGSVRSGKDKSGKAWSNTLQHHYGYIKGSVGNDKDHVDLFVKPGTPLDYSGQVFVIDQVHPDTGRFDEHKVVIGAKNGMEARRIYQANYAKGWKGLKALTAMPFDQFKTWVKDGPKNKPVSSEKPVSQPQEQTSEKAPKAIEATAQQQAAGPATNPAKPAASDGVAAAPEAGQPAEPVAPKSLREAVNRNRAKNAKSVEPVEQPTEAVKSAEESSSRPGEPSAEQIKSVKDITLTKKVGDSVVKKTSNASNAMKAINERADALEMVRKCLA